MTPKSHPFTRNPHRTLISFSIPVLFSMTAEPITALVDTAFISSLGVNPLAALGVGTTALSSIFWVFNFLGIGTQTEVAQVYGKGRADRAERITSLALVLAVIFGLFLIVVLGPTSNWLAGLLGAAGPVQAYAVSYMRIRLFGAPAVLLMMVSFGALRGLQDMRTPLWVALGQNGLNVLLDWLFIFGLGPFPELGVAGSALASTLSQWVGAVTLLVLIFRKIGLSWSFRWRDATNLLQVGGDLFVRTALMNVFLIYITRAANNIGANAGAAHQVIRQVHGFTALALDAYATTVQSLVGYFIGRSSLRWAKRVVTVGAYWSVGTAVALGVLMWVGRGVVIDLLVPAASIAMFVPAWAASAIFQPLNSIAFLTDGTHWGTGDYRFLRNAMFIASLTGVIGIWIGEQAGIQTLVWVWIMVGVWNTVRATFGLLRIWPGIGKSALRKIN